jgi:glycosyltransferase involved in cell wall biosynthesis
MATLVDNLRDREYLPVNGAEGQSVGRKVTVVIPAFNEEQAIGRVLAAVNETCPHLIEETIVVDDGSSDQTARVAEDAGARVIRHRYNMGYGAALKTGIHSARTEFVITLDADGQHRVQDLFHLWEAAEANDMVVGARQRLMHSPLWRMPGKWLLGFMANYLTRRSIPDLNSGLRLMRREVILNYLHLCPSGFSFSTTISMALLCRGHRVAYVPIDVEKRIGKSNVSVATGFETVMLILRIIALFAPLRIFIPASFLIGLSGVIWSIPFILTGRGVSVGSMLAMVTAVLLFSLGLLCDQISQLRLEKFE